MVLSNNIQPRFKPDQTLKLMDQVHQVMRYQHYAKRTEKTYCSWIIKYIKFFGGSTHPSLLGKEHIERFLSHLATNCFH